MAVKSEVGVEVEIEIEVAGRRESWLTLRGRALLHACHGLRVLAREPHARVHGVATLGAVVLGILCNISRLEWCALVATISAVWAVEGLNTALEYVCDAAVPERHPLVACAKDAAAAAVLIVAIASVIVGAVIFGPYL